MEAIAGISKNSLVDYGTLKKKLVQPSGACIPAGQPEKCWKEKMLAKKPWEEVRQMSIPDKQVALFETEKYKSCATIAANPHAMIPVKYLIDTGGGPNFKIKVFLYSTSIDHIKWHCFLKKKSTNQLPIRLESIILLHLRIGDVCMQIRFAVINNVAIDTLLRTLLIGR